ncbi:Bacteriophage P2-related tail formation protein [Chromobacterium violaceum]|uniref:Bacteriophage P2-related tail formation protein n=1 Tax=Chromobacterium violaceum TaxID=536 RepID=A0A3S4LGE5_CHRVL|nr:Bacteriophage P2-related tail formation protein [Chromobacterium violaceum]
MVGPLWAYLPDDAAKRRAIKESAAWHRAKGSPWSVEAALSWAGYAAKVEDATAPAGRWAEFQLELARRWRARLCRRCWNWPVSPRRPARTWRACMAATTAAC